MVYAEIPVQAAADAPFIHAWIRNQQSDRTQETYAATISRFYREVRKPLAAVTLYSYANNARARRSYEKVGFRLEGTLRGAQFVGGRYVDELVMGLLPEELAEELAEGPS